MLDELVRGSEGGVYRTLAVIEITRTSAEYLQHIKYVSFACSLIHTVTVHSFFPPLHKTVTFFYGTLLFVVCIWYYNRNFVFPVFFSFS